MMQKRATDSGWEILVEDISDKIPNLKKFCRESITSFINKEGGRCLPDHVHNCLEIVVMIEGEQNYCIERQDYHISGGDVIITYPDEIHGLHNQSWNTCEVMWIQVYLTDSDAFLGLSGQFAKTLYDCIVRKSIRKKHVDKATVQMLIDIQTDLMCDNDDQITIINAYAKFSGFLIHLFCQNAAQNESKSKDIQLAIDYILDHLSFNTSIIDLAQKLGVAEVYFKKKFKQETGVSPRHYIIMRIVEAVKTELLGGQSSITGIAFKYEFNSSSYFSYLFKKETGYTPKEYRELFHN